jgi:hypothetical protein
MAVQPPTRWQSRSGSRKVVAAEEVDDLAYGWLVGHHAGVALVLVKAETALKIRSAVSLNSSGRCRRRPRRLP